LIRIALTGPESTGKTTLVHQLASKYNSKLVQEYAREYLKSKSGYKREDLLKIAKGQYQSILDATSDGIVFIDTDLLVVKIWSFEKYGECDSEIERLYSSLKIDFYLLTYPDLAWKNDPLRESKNELLSLYRVYKRELDKVGVPYKVITGQGNTRLINAVEFVNKFIASIKE